MSVPASAPVRADGASGAPPRVRRRVRPCVVLAALLLGACGRDGGRAARAVPTVEFLLAAGDSTYWVATGPGGARLRGAPLLLARWDDRLFEVYAADDDRSYYDAVFTSQRVYRRDLLSGDSSAVFDDPRVPALADLYATAHPTEQPLAPDEDAADEPGTVATSDVLLLDVHGPYLTVEQRADVEAPSGDHEHRIRRAVVDLRSGRRVATADLFGERASAWLVAEGRRRLAAAIDSLGVLTDDGEARAGVDARRALRTLRFDPSNVGLAAVGMRPAAVFVAVGADAEGRAVALTLAPIALPASEPVPAWWTRDVAATLPVWRADSSEARWPLGGDAALLARPSDGALQLSLRLPGRRGAVAIGDVPGPVRQLLPLGRRGFPEPVRRALRRAFDESAFYGEATTSVAWHPAPPR